MQRIIDWTSYSQYINQFENECDYSTIYLNFSVKQGEFIGVVTGTGANTYFGKAATLMQEEFEVSNDIFIFL